jgi:PAS domain-containing protein
MKMKDKTKKQKGKRANLVTFIQHETVNEQAEDTLQQTEARYSTLLESIQDSVYIYDTEGLITYVNDAVVRRTELQESGSLENIFLFFSGRKTESVS